MSSTNMSDNVINVDDCNKLSDIFSIAKFNKTDINYINNLNNNISESNCLTKDVTDYITNNNDYAKNKQSYNNSIDFMKYGKKVFVFRGIALIIVFGLIFLLYKINKKGV